MKSSVDLSIESLQARRHWNDTFQMLKEKTSNQEYYTQQNSFKLKK